MKLGEEITITITLKNASAEPIRLSNEGFGGPGGEGIYVQVRDSGGRLSPIREAYRRNVQEGQDGSSFMFTIPAGKETTSKLSIGKLYDVSVAGKYTIQIERTWGGVAVKSNVVVVTVEK